MSQNTCTKKNDFPKAGQIFIFLDLSSTTHPYTRTKFVIYENYICRLSPMCIIIPFKLTITVLVEV